MKAGFMLRSITDRPETVITEGVATTEPGSTVQDAFSPERSILLRTLDKSYYIDIELPADDPDIVQGIGLVDFKMPADGQVTVQGWTDTIDGSAQVVNETFNPWSAFLGFGTGGFGAGEFGGHTNSGSNPSIQARATDGGRVALLKDLPAAGNTARYWRILFTSATPNLFCISRIMLGRIWRPASCMRRAWPLRTEYLNPVRSTPAGQEYTDETPNARHNAPLEFDWLSEGDADYIWEAASRLGPHTPVLARLRPSEGPSLLFHTLYGTLRDVTRARRNVMFSRVSVTVREAL